MTGPEMHEQDKKYMNLAIELSKTATYPYGAVIVKDDKVIGRSDAETSVSKNAFSHAELRAIEDALKHLGGGVSVCSGWKWCNLIFFMRALRNVYGRNSVHWH